MAVKCSCFIAYLNNNIFPPLLSAAEEAETIARLADTDAEVRGSAKNKLIEHNLRLVAHVANKFDSTNIDRDDLLSIGTIGLIKGINSFQPDKGARLATYAARCIENEILMHIRATRHAKGEVSLFDPVGVDKEGNEMSLLDILAEEDTDLIEQVAADEQRQQMRGALSVLDATEQLVLTRRYGLDGREQQTQRQVAGILGISRSYVSRLEKKAIAKLRRALQVEE
ncbi:MAG: RNA polymerase sporulation sigma factor SigK [Firmicutes bacterium]|nr:RNA polymerase sporulation sigma factor SigK [Bacillota bacterium]